MPISDQDFFWNEYKKLESIPYDNMNPLQKAIVGMANFTGFACISGFDDQIIHVGWVSLADSEDALRRIGRADIADAVKRGTELIRDCCKRHGLTDQQIDDDWEVSFRHFFGDQWEKDIEADLRRIQNENFGIDITDELEAQMGRYLRTTMNSV